MVALFAILAATIAVLSQSLPSQAVQAPGLNTAPVISSTGSFGVSTGKILSVNTGDWTDSPTGYTYQWYRCTSSLSATSTDPTNCQSIAGSTASTHRLSRSDVGFYMVAKVTATNGLGSTYTYSASTIQVRQANSVGLAYGIMCEIRSGRLYCAGANGSMSNGQAALVGSESFGTAQKTFYGPVTLADGTVLTDLVSVSVYYTNTCVINITGNVFCNGAAGASMFSDGFGSGQRQFFTQMYASAGVPITGATSIAVTDTSYCFTKKTAGVSNVWCAGLGTYGALAQGTSVNSSYPVAALISSGTPLTGALQVFGGSTGSGGGTYCATASDGTTVGAKLYCWGSNAYAQLGQGDTTARITYMSPVSIGGSAVGFSYISLGASVCAIKDNGVSCWGDDSAGQLGRGSTGTTRLTAATPSTFNSVSFGADSGWVQAEVPDSTSSQSHVCLLNVSGAVYCSGNNANYQQDLGSAAGTASTFNFKPAIDWNSGISDVEIGYLGTCVTKVATNTLSCLGPNDYGQFANNTQTATGATPLTITSPAGSLGTSPLLPSALNTTISGNNAIGYQLQPNSTWLGFPQPTLSHQWYSCDSSVTAASSVPANCVAISNANSATYMVTAGDSGKYLTDFVTATNDAGTTTTVLSASNPVGDLPTTATAPTLVTPVSSIGAAIGQTFTGVPGSWSAVSPVGISTYQWFRCFSAGAASASIPSDCSAIFGETSLTYTAGKPDSGQFLRFGMVYSSTAGKVTTLSATTNQLRIVTTLASSDNLTCAMRLGKLSCWGPTTTGELGFSPGGLYSMSANPVVNADGTPMTGVVQFAVGQNHVCAVKIDRTLWCWGKNDAGQMGTGSTGTGNPKFNVKFVPVSLSARKSQAFLHTLPCSLKRM